MITQATISDGTTTYTIPAENVSAVPIINANTSITIGGIVNSQADSRRLRITTIMSVPQSDVNIVDTILTNFSQTLKYKPSRLLWNRTTIEELSVVMTKSPEIPNRVYNNEKIFYIRLELEEIIET